MLLVDVVAAKPDEVVPVAHLIFHFAELASGLGFEVGALLHPGRVAVPVGAHRHDVADLSVLQTLHAFDVTRVMMALETDADFQILPLRLLSGCEKLAHAGAVHRHRLFREDVFALAHRFLELHRAEAGRCGENHHVGQRDGLLVAIEAEEPVVIRDFDFVFVGLREALEAAVHAVLMHVRDGDELHALAGAEGLVGRAGTAPAAADEGDLERVPGRDRAEGEALDGQRAEGGGAGDRFGSAGEETPARESLRGRDDFVHKQLG